MCGCYAQGEPTEVLEDVFSITDVGSDIPDPSWNIRPTQNIPIVVESNKNDSKTQRRLERAKWSLIPAWAEDDKLKFSTFNARSEDAATKATWKDSVRSHRCLIPASGYYEWKLEDGAKTPFYIHGKEPLAFAGLYSWWRRDSESPWILSATILTMPSVPQLAEIHDRNPVPIPKEYWATWLCPETTGSQLLVDEAAAQAVGVASQLEFHRVLPVRGNGPELIAPITGE